MEYKVAATDDDYKLCYDLMKTEKVDHVDLELPTVMALDDDEQLMGFLGTHTNNDMIFAGPLVLADKNVLIAYTLCELYETAMRSLGVKAYIMTTEDGNFMDLAIKRYNPPNLEQYAREGSRTFYIRRL